MPTQFRNSFPIAISITNIETITQIAYTHVFLFIPNFTYIHLGGTINQTWTRAGWLPRKSTRNRALDNGEADVELVSPDLCCFGN